MRCGIVIAGLLAAGVAAMVPGAAEADPCSLTGVTLDDVSPSKGSADEVDRQSSTKVVGQEVRLTAVLQGAPPDVGTVSYRWTVGGDAIRDYDDVEPIMVGSVLTFAPVAFSVRPADDQDGAGNSLFDTGRPGLRFFWRMRNTALPLADVPVTVQVLEQHPGDPTPHACAGVTATRQHTVTRNRRSREHQPEDFYVEINHARRIHQTHANWHSLFNPRRPGYRGRAFLVFHRAYLANYDAWRAEFGYPPKGVYQPLNAGARIPDEDDDGYTLAHVPRLRQSSDHGRPSWTRAGSAGAAVEVDPLCQPHFPAAMGPAKLEDFGTNIDFFGCQLEFTWHGDPHVDIGGDMGHPSTAQMDPIFWRWHGFVDGVYQAYLNTSGVAAPASAAAVLAAPRRHVPAAGQAQSGGRCLGLRPTERGTSGADTIVGTQGRDVIAGAAGNDRIRALGGDDVVCGGPGRDRLSGGSGDESIMGDAGADRIRGNAGRDTIEAGAGNDRVSAGSGADLPSGGSGDDVVEGGTGSEWMIIGGSGDDRLDGGPGRDHLEGGPGSDRLEGGSGMDSLVGDGGNDRLDGGAGEDTVMYVTARRGVDVDLRDGEARGQGADRISDVEGVMGSGHDDDITGGRDDEELEGGLGDDQIAAGGGDDTVNGGAGNDDCKGETESSC
jgi:hypothetical protein